MTIPTKAALPLAGVLVVFGMVLTLIFWHGPTKDLGEAQEIGRDTIFVEVPGEVFRDTITQTKPVFKYVARHDTTRDTVYIERLRHYEAKQTFSDSCSIKHGWDLNDGWIALNHIWDYQPPPQREIIVHQVQKVYPGRLERVSKTLGAVAFGAGVTAIVNNNK